MKTTSPGFDLGDHFKFSPSLSTGFNKSCYHMPKIPVSLSSPLPVTFTAVQKQESPFQCRPNSWADWNLLVDPPSRFAQKPTNVFWWALQFSISTSILLKFPPRLHVHSIWNNPQNGKDHKALAQAYMKQHLIFSKQDKVWRLRYKGRDQDR